MPWLPLLGGDDLAWLGGGDLARQEEDVQHLPPWSLLLFCLHWLQHIVANTGDYHEDFYNVKDSVHIFSWNHKDSFSTELDLWRSRELHRGLSRERACYVSHPIVVSIFVIIIIKQFTIIFLYNNNDLNQERNSLWLPCLCKLDLSIHCCCSRIKVTS